MPLNSYKELLWGQSLVGRSHKGALPASDDRAQINLLMWLIIGVELGLRSCLEPVIRHAWGQNRQRTF
jgi:hypothetical protein